MVLYTIPIISAIHYDKIRLFNAVNLENELKTIDIFHHAK